MYVFQKRLIQEEERLSFQTKLTQISKKAETTTSN